MLHDRAVLSLQVADIWSCGVMLYVMLVGAYPFERPEDKTDSQKLQKMIQVQALQPCMGGGGYGRRGCCVSICMLPSSWCSSTYESGAVRGRDSTFLFLVMHEAACKAV